MTECQSYQQSSPNSWQCHSSVLPFTPLADYKPFLIFVSQSYAPLHRTMKLRILNLIRHAAIALTLLAQIHGRYSYAKSLNQRVPFSFSMASTPGYPVTLTLNSGWGLFGRDIYYRIIEPNFTEFLMWDTVVDRAVPLTQATAKFYSTYGANKSQPVSLIRALKASDYYSDISVEYRLFYDTDVKSLRNANITNRPGQIITFRLGNPSSTVNALSVYSRDLWYVLDGWDKEGFRFQKNFGDLVMLVFLCASTLGVLSLYMQSAHNARSRKKIKKLIDGDQKDEAADLSNLKDVSSSISIHLHHHHHLNKNKKGNERTSSSHLAHLPKGTMASLPAEIRPGHLPPAAYKPDERKRGGRFVDLTDASSRSSSALSNDSSLQISLDSLSNPSIGDGDFKIDGGALDIERMSGFSESVLQAMEASNAGATSLILNSYATNYLSPRSSSTKNSRPSFVDCSGVYGTPKREQNSHVSFSESLSSNRLGRSSLSPSRPCSPTLRHPHISSLHKAFTAEKSYQSLSHTRTSRESRAVQSSAYKKADTQVDARSALLSRDLSELASVSSLKQRSDNSFVKSYIRDRSGYDQFESAPIMPQRPVPGMSRTFSSASKSSQVTLSTPNDQFDARRSTSSGSYKSRSSSLRYSRSRMRNSSFRTQMNATPPLPDIAGISGLGRMPPNIPPRPPIKSSRLRESIKSSECSLNRPPASMYSLDNNSKSSILESPTRLIRPLAQRNIL